MTKRTSPEPPVDREALRANALAHIRARVDRTMGCQCGHDGEEYDNHREDCAMKAQVREQYQKLVRKDQERLFF